MNPHAGGVHPKEEKPHGGRKRDALGLRVDAQERGGGTTMDTWRLTTLDIEEVDSELGTRNGGGTSTTEELGHDSSARGADGSG